MSLIEQAAKRLEELRKSGVDVPDALVEESPEEIADRPVAPRRPRNPLERDSRRARSALRRQSRKARSDKGRRCDRASRRSVHIDLARLAAAGFVTPDAPRTKLASEFRMIKRPLLANAQATARGPVAQREPGHGDERGRRRRQEFHRAQSRHEHGDGARQHGAAGRRGCRASGRFSTSSACRRARA